MVINPVTCYKKFSTQITKRPPQNLRCALKFSQGTSYNIMRYISPKTPPSQNPQIYVSITLVCAYHNPPK